MFSALFLRTFIFVKLYSCQRLVTHQNAAHATAHQPNIDENPINLQNISPHEFVSKHTEPTTS